MARMTKLQIDYMRNKIENKVNELIAEKSREMKAAGLMSLYQLEQAMTKTEIVKWAKTLPKAKLVSMINETGEIQINKPYKGYRDTVIDQIREAEGAPGYSDFNDFVQSKKVRPLLRQIEKNEKKLSEYRGVLEKEADELMDTLVLSGSANGVKYAIDRFMEK